MKNKRVQSTYLVEPSLLLPRRIEAKSEGVKQIKIPRKRTDTVADTVRPVQAAPPRHHARTSQPNLND